MMDIHPPAHLPGDVRATIFKGTQQLTLQTSMFRGLQNGLGTRLGVIPQQTPVNPKKTKIGALQNGCPKLISRPQTQSSYKACVLKNGLFGNMSYL